MKDLLQELEEARKSIWLTKPDEVERVRGRKGARGQNFSIMVYAEGDTRGVIDFLHSVRTTVKEENIDLKTMIAIAVNHLEFQANRFERYYDMVDLPGLMKKTSTGLKEVKDKEEYLRLIEAFMLYIGKINYWLDLEIPWSELAERYESVKAS